MVRIYNETDGTYLTIAEYIAAYDADDADTYYVQFLWKLTDLFDKAKERTALRGKYARDEQGRSLLERYMMTDDEEDFFDEMLEMGSGDLFSHLIAWTKNVFKSYQYKVLHDFEEDYSKSGDINTYQTIPGVYDLLEDLDANWAADELIGMVFAVTSGSHQGYFTIVDNTATAVFVDGNFGGNVTGETYLISGNSQSVEEQSLQIFLTMPTTPYMDLFDLVETRMEEALTLYTIKEWYRLAGLFADYQIEEKRYEDLAREIRSLVMQKADPDTARRKKNMLGCTDY